MKHAGVMAGHDKMDIGYALSKRPTFFYLRTILEGGWHDAAARHDPVATAIDVPRRFPRFPEIEKQFNAEYRPVRADFGDGSVDIYVRRDVAWPDPPPLLVLGIDGATRTIMDPLMEQGRLPNMKRLAERGLYTALGTQNPTISPIIWTSIATGKLEAKHGVHNFTAPVPGTELESRFKVPEARSSMRLSFTGVAPEGLSHQKATVSVAGKVRGEIELVREPRTQSIDVTLDEPAGDKPAPAAPASEVVLAFQSSVRKGPSPMYQTALLNVTAAIDGAPPVELSPADGIAGVYKVPVAAGSTAYLELGRARDIVTTSSNMRLCKAIWNIASERGRSCLISGYWVTWPAEKVNGTLISSYTSARWGRSKKGSFLKDFPHQTYPEELAGSLAPIMERAIDSAKTRAQKVAERFGVELTPIPATELKPTVQLVTPGNEKVEPLPPGMRAEQLLWIASSDDFYALATAHLWPEKKPNLTILYLGEIDVVSHDWYDLEKDLTRGVIAEAYERADAALGNLLASLGPEADRANVVVLSDHGFSYDERGVFEHQFTHPPGILIMAGPSIKPGIAPREPNVMDACPTFLTLLGLPAARDMDGRVLSEALTVPALEPVATYETAPPPKDPVPIVAPVDGSVKDQLCALGYVACDGLPR
ncbi:MAG: alkaline phosphatase family protein [Acidobacteriota bacterium]